MILKKMMKIYPAHNQTRIYPADLKGHMRRVEEEDEEEEKMVYLYQILRETTSWLDRYQLAPPKCRGERAAKRE